MRSLAICGDHLDPLVKTLATAKIELDGVPLVAGLLATPDLDFDPQSLEHRDRVLVKKLAFSCNYRDKGLMLTASAKLQPDRYYTIGSEFVAEVVAVGAEVTDLNIGDRVIGNNQYPDSGVAGIAPGVPTNHASKEYQIFHPVKLLKIPPQMPDEIAAVFSIGAQTTYSMIRKLNIKPGNNILVTAGKSNTSLFAIAALKQHNVNVYVTTTSIEFAQKFYDLGVKQVIEVDLTADKLIPPEIARVIKHEIDGFDCIIDPFFDLHIGKTIQTLVDGGRYVTCGLYHQFLGTAFEYRGLALKDIMTIVMLKNIQIIGNCVGQTSDLANAIEDYVTGKFPVAIDSVWSDDRLFDFFNRTYHAKDRFGKVVYRYN
ncbi:quinone oxidoreductase family protein [Chamaesiphon polymorphus]|uniref:Alcohol dehydrogenase n=1 Tax=Chamaesiphon polymorphus CCALA 037 TaxID=2107692 RepID=A0A2T1GFW4_9CYAN|nr:zinc-binding alcohol dehydrogenase family protein [Chamaesiphon polymorphus]PSB56450.1 alcohol dehydrogenase [Chamaesiphon polymorphus CCALA 037]